MTPKKREQISAALFCIVCAMLDVVTTYIVVEQLGGIELNPLMNHVINFGWEWLILVKLIVPVSVPLAVKTFAPQKITLFSMWIILASIQLFASIFNTINIIIHFTM